MKTILVIDDDEHIGNLLEEALGQAGYGVMRGYSGTEALLLMEKRRPDLVLLDLMLPGLEGEKVLPRLADVPVIVMSAKADVEGKVALLQGGAADYVTKPFDIRELLARIAVQLRAPAPRKSSLAWRGLSLDPDTRTISAPGGEARLTRTECALLRLLMGNPGQVMTKSRLLDEMGPDSPDCTETSLKMHVSNLRRKLHDLDPNVTVEAVWGIGYRLDGPEN